MRVRLTWTGKLKALFIITILYNSHISANVTQSTDTTLAPLFYHLHLVIKSPRYLIPCLKKPLSPNPEGALHFSGREPWPQTWKYWLSSQPLHTQLHAKGHALMKPREPHHPQTAGMLLWGSQISGHPPPHPGYASRFCLWKSKTELETRVRHPINANRAGRWAGLSASTSQIIFSDNLIKMFQKLRIAQTCWRGLVQ